MSQLSNFDPASYMGGNFHGLTPGNTPEGSQEPEFIIPPSSDEPPLALPPTLPNTASTLQPAPPVEAPLPNLS